MSPLASPSATLKALLALLLTSPLLSPHLLIAQPLPTAPSELTSPVEAPQEQTEDQTKEQTEDPQPQGPVLCMLSVSDIKALQRKLNYQLWDSIEELKPDLHLVVKLGELTLIDAPLGKERYEQAGALSAPPQPCEAFQQAPILARVYDLDRGTKRELIAELSTQLSSLTPSSLPHERLLSGGALRSLKLTLSTSPNKPAEIKK